MSSASAWHQNFVLIENFCYLAIIRQSIIDSMKYVSKKLLALLFPNGLCIVILSHLFGFYYADQGWIW